MDSQLRSNGSNTRPNTQAAGHPAGRSRVAGRVERVVNTALVGEKAAVLNATAAELLAEPGPVGDVIGEALGRPGNGVMAHWNLHELLRRSQLHEDLVNSLTAANPVTRAAAARLCGAARAPGPPAPRPPPGPAGRGGPPVRRRPDDRRRDVDRRPSHRPQPEGARR